jgi:6-phosphogluconolactonase
MKMSIDTRFLKIISTFAGTPSVHLSRLNAKTMRTLLFFALVSCLACQSKMTKNPKLSFFIGTYTQHEGHVDGKGNGIYKLTFDPATLDLQMTDTIKGMTNPSFLALSADQSKLYAVNEISPGSSAIGLFEVYDVSAKAFGKKLFSASTESYAPCQIALNKSENMAVVANYVEGVVSVFPLPLTRRLK